jgi:hypothetical protein
VDADCGLSPAKAVGSPVQYRQSGATFGLQTPIRGESACRKLKNVGAGTRHVRHDLDGGKSAISKLSIRNPSFNSEHAQRWLSGESAQIEPQDPDAPQKTAVFRARVCAGWTEGMAQ